MKDRISICRWCSARIPYVRRPGGPRKYCPQCSSYTAGGHYGKRALVKVARACGTCAKWFVPMQGAPGNTQFCSKDCAAFWRSDRRRPRVVRCHDCHTRIAVVSGAVRVGDATPGFGPRYCDGCSASRRKDRNRRKNLIRRRARGGSYSLTYIAERDGNQCHLCGKRVDVTLSGAHQHGPTIDHLIPVSQGGTDEPRNVKLAHRQCNVTRNVGGQVQLLLVG